MNAKWFVLNGLTLVNKIVLTIAQLAQLFQELVPHQIMQNMFMSNKFKEVLLCVG
jgi:hypothetical protein